MPPPQPTGNEHENEDKNEDTSLADLHDHMPCGYLCCWIFFLPFAYCAGFLLSPQHKGIKHKGVEHKGPEKGVKKGVEQSAGGEEKNGGQEGDEKSRDGEEKDGEGRGKRVVEENGKCRGWRGWRWRRGRRRGWI